ncbi:MAG: hypothetical protein AAF202_01955 [Pseudomonadota bacterium]
MKVKTKLFVFILVSVFFGPSAFAESLFDGCGPSNATSDYDLKDSHFVVPDKVMMALSTEKPAFMNEREELDTSHLSPILQEVAKFAAEAEARRVAHLKDAIARELDGHIGLTLFASTSSLCVDDSAEPVMLRSKHDPDRVVARWSDQYGENEYVSTADEVVARPVESVSGLRRVGGAREEVYHVRARVFESSRDYRDWTIGDDDRSSGPLFFAYCPIAYCEAN